MNTGIISQIVKRILNYWFIQYNPLYSFSALCVLTGVYLITENLQAWFEGQIVLAFTMQLYEFILIGGGALLFHYTRQYRPAVILGIMAVFFLFDCTLRTEGLATLGLTGMVLSIIWTVLMAVKLRLLAWSFRLQIPRIVYCGTWIAAAAIAGAAHLLNSESLDRSLIIMLLSWVGCVVALGLLWLQPPIKFDFMPTIGCDFVLSSWGQTVLKRAVTATWVAWTIFYYLHLISLALIFDVTWSLFHIIPLLATLPMWSRRETVIWPSAVLAVVISLLEPQTIAPIALMTASVLAWQARRIHQPRLYIGSVLMTYVGIWTLGLTTLTLPPPNLALNIIAALILIAIAWHLRKFNALLVAGLCMLPGITLYMPQTHLQWGVFSLVIGFVALIVGIAINWWWRNKDNAYMQLPPCNLTEISP